MVDRVFRLGLLAAAVLAILGCGGNSSSGNGSNQAPAATANFSLSVPTEITVAPNSLQSISISVVPTNGFSSAVNVVLSGLPSGVTATPSTFTLTPGTSAQRRVVAGVSAEDASAASSQTVMIATGADVAPGPVNLVVTGTSGSLSQSTTTSTSQADFALSASSQTVALAAGGTAQVSVYATSFDGFSGQIAATLVGLPAGVTASPSTLTLTPGTPQTVTLSAAVDIQPGTTTLGLQGTSGALANNIEFELALSATPIVAPDYSLSLTLSAITLSAGGSPGQVTLSAIPINGFTGPVAVGLYGLPSGVVAMPANFLLTPGIPQQISLTAASTATAGTTALLISTSTGVLAHTTELPVTITPPPPNFSFEVTPASLTLNAGGSAQSVSITATALYGFSGTINVALSGLPAGVTASPASLTLTPGVTQAVNLTAASNAAPGAGTLNLFASSGTISNSASVGLTIDTPTPDFVFSATPSTITVTPGTFQPVVLSIVPLSGFNSGVTVTTGTLPDGVVVSPAIGTGGSTYFPLPETLLPLAPNVPEVVYIGLPSGASSPVTFDFRATAGSLAHDAAVTASLASTSNPGSDFYLTSVRPGLMLYPGGPASPTAQDMQIQAASFSTASPPAPAISLTGALPPGMVLTQAVLPAGVSGVGLNFTVASGLIGTSGILTFQASNGSQAREIDIPYSVVAGPEMTQLLIPSTTLTLPQGGTEILYVALASTTPYGALETFSTAGLPTGILDASDGVVFPGVVIDQFTAPENTPVGQTPVTITSTSYGMTQSSQFTLNVVSLPYFTLSATPNTLNLTAGSTQAVSIEADAVNGFTGNVNAALTASGSVTVNPSTLTLTPGVPQQVTVSAANTTGSASGEVTVQATAGTISQSADVFVGTPTPDFSVQVPASITLGDTFGGNFPVIPTNFVGAIDEVLSGLPPGVLVGSGIFPNDIYLNRQLPLTLLANCGQILPINPSQGSCSAYDYVLEYNGAAAGTYPLTLTATFVPGPLQPQGSPTTQITHTYQFSLVVVPPTFSLSASLASLTIAPGSPQMVTVTATQLTPPATNTKPIEFLLRGLPSGVTATAFSSTTSGSTYSTTYNLTVAAGTPAGSSTLTVNAVNEIPVYPYLQPAQVVTNTIEIPLTIGP